MCQGTISLQTHQAFHAKHLLKEKSKNWDILNNCCNCPNNETVCFYNAVKDADGTANSGDPDQTALFRSSLIWVCTICSDLFVPVFRIFMVAVQQ